MQHQSIRHNITGIVTKFVSNKSLNYSSIQRHVRSSHFQSGCNSKFESVQESVQEPFNIVNVHFTLKLTLSISRTTY